MLFNAFLTILFVALAACGQTVPAPQPNIVDIPPKAPSGGNTVMTRFAPPTGYGRIPVDEHSFAHYLRHLPLKPEGAAVHLFDGREKMRQDVHAAVVDMEVGNRDLQQCADAIMRLKAEYLFAEKRYDDIRFNFTNGFPAEYRQWRKGKRIVVSGNRCEWRNSASPTDGYQAFREYLDMVFMYAGTLSLSKELF